MTAFESLNRGQRCWAIAVISALPCCSIGFFVGEWASGLGSDTLIGNILWRLLACIVPAAVLGTGLPRYWLVPVFFYLWAFDCGYQFTDTFRLIPWVSVAPLALLTGQKVAPLHEHRELPWLLGFALCSAAFAALLRSRLKRDSNPTTQNS